MVEPLSNNQVNLSMLLFAVMAFVDCLEVDDEWLVCFRSCSFPFVVRFLGAFRL